MRAVVLISALLCLGGCTGEDEAPAHTGVAPVHTGAVYRFSGLAGSVHSFEVTRVPDDAIRYTVRTRVSEQEVADPLEDQRFPLAPAGKLPKGEDGTLRLGGRAWPVRISTTDERVTWTAQAEGRPAFPGVLKITQGGETVWELSAIEAPAQAK